MLPFTGVLAVHSILEKFLLYYFDYWSLFFWNLLGAFCGVLFLMLFSKLRREFIETVRTVGRNAFFVVFVGESIYFLGAICWLIAASVGYVSLVSALAGLQSFFVFVYVIFSSLFVPQHLEEDLSRGVIMLKISAIALIIAGTWLVTG